VSVRERERERNRTMRDEEYNLYTKSINQEKQKETKKNEEW